MPFDRIEKTLAAEITALDKAGKGPRYLLDGEGDREFLRMNGNGYLGLSLNAEIMAAAGVRAVDILDSPSGAALLKHLRAMTAKFESGLTEIRFQVSADHTGADIDEALAVLAAFKTAA